MVWEQGVAIIAMVTAEEVSACSSQFIFSSLQRAAKVRHPEVIFPEDSRGDRGLVKAGCVKNGPRARRGLVLLLLNYSCL